MVLRRRGERRDNLAAAAVLLDLRLRWQRPSHAIALYAKKKMELGSQNPNEICGNSYNFDRTRAETLLKNRL